MAKSLRSKMMQRLSITSSWQRLHASSWKNNRNTTSKQWNKDWKPRVVMMATLSSLASIEKYDSSVTNQVTLKVTSLVPDVWVKPTGRLCHHWEQWRTRIRTPAFQDPPHDYLYCSFISDPKSKQDKVIVTNCQKFKFWKFARKLYTQHTFWTCLIRCVTMKWIQLVLWELQSGHDSYPPFNFVEAGGINMILLVPMK